MTSAPSYAVLRPPATPEEHDHARVLLIMPSAEEAHAVAEELRRRGVSTEIRAAFGSGRSLRLYHRQM